MLTLRIQEQDIAINEKASKSYVENEDLKIMDYLDNVVYSYGVWIVIYIIMLGQFIFRDIGSEFFKPFTKPGDGS